MIADQSFSRDCRIRKSYEYKYLQKNGIRRSTRHFILVIIFRNEAPNRLGLTVSRKVGGAVQRNRVKRLLREFFRSSRCCFPRHLDLNIIARRGAQKLDLEAVRMELQPLLYDMFG